MTVTSAKGFSATGVASGLKANGNLDLALVVNQGPLQLASAVFTSNRCQANPIIWSKQVLADGLVAAMVINSGGANCYTGPVGFQTTHATAEHAAKLLQLSSSDVVICSTGIIGEQLNRPALLAGLDIAVPQLAATELSGLAAARAIMTTDSRPKFSTFTHVDGWTIGGMAKGAGMLAPGLATMLVVLTTDAIVNRDELDRALQVGVAVSFNRLDSDGCMSTNDQVTLLCSGASGVVPSANSFETLLTKLCVDLAKQLMSDAEGASHDIEIQVIGSASEADADEVGRAVARNNLFKAAIYGNDPNWGRILAAVGTTKAVFDPYDIDVSLNGVRVSSAGQPDQSPALIDLRDREVQVLIDLKSGDHSATIYTNDLTHAYVTENSAHSS